MPTCQMFGEIEKKSVLAAELKEKNLKLDFFNQLGLRRVFNKKKKNEL